MIPADHISFNDDGTEAWLVVSSPVDAQVALDRPCDTCGTLFDDDIRKMSCDCIDGRHTFTIEVEVPYTAWQMGCTRSEVERDGGKWPDPMICTYRVSVIPGMVLPITDYGTNLGRGHTYPFITLNDGRAVLHHIPGAMAERRQITLPPAAAPGMWAVKLKVG